MHTVNAPDPATAARRAREDARQLRVKVAQLKDQIKTQQDARARAERERVTTRNNWLQEKRRADHLARENNLLRASEVATAVRVEALKQENDRLEQIIDSLGGAP